MGGSVTRGPSVQRIANNLREEANQLLRKELNSRGATSSEAARLAGNLDLQDRLYFYINIGEGIHKEPGVGSYPHIVQLDNLYDMTVDPLDLRVGHSANDFGRAVMAAGFDGYFDRHYGISVILGKRTLPVTPVDKIK